MSIDVLQAKIHKLKSPVMVGLDPSPALIPPSLIEGEGIAAIANALVDDAPVRDTLVEDE